MSIDKALTLPTWHLSAKWQILKSLLRLSSLGRISQSLRARANDSVNEWFAFNRNPCNPFSAATAFAVVSNSTSPSPDSRACHATPRRSAVSRRERTDRDRHHQSLQSLHRDHNSSPLPSLKIIRGGLGPQRVDPPFSVFSYKPLTSKATNNVAQPP